MDKMTVNWTIIFDSWLLLRQAIHQDHKDK